MNEHDFDKSLFRKMRESMKPGDDVKAELYRKIDSLENYREPTVKTSKTPFKFLNWVPLTAMACILVVAGVLIYPHVSREANYVPDDIIETPVETQTSTVIGLRPLPDDTQSNTRFFKGHSPTPKPETAEALKTAYARYASDKFDMEITADDVTIAIYFGDYYGNPVAMMHVKDWTLVNYYGALYQFYDEKEYEEYGGPASKWYLNTHVLYNGEVIDIHLAQEIGVILGIDIDEMSRLYYRNTWNTWDNEDDGYALYETERFIYTNILFPTYMVTGTKAQYLSY
ncbi:MAG: hypothetical protein FWE60_03260, partial [Oscillospiraceae bacterium]|nr:hypothetical protein [Oscillospiraceae bacterium]